MRNKLLKHGTDVFETYELLEMLLFELIRHRDTNPQAKRLMQSYGSIDNVFAASASELSQIDGIGEKTARYISSVGRAQELLSLKYGAKRAERYDSFDKAGGLAVEHFKDCHSYRVALFLFDNSMSLISVHDIADVDYDSAAIKPITFIDIAMAEGASVVVIAHNHPYGPLGYSQGDRQTQYLIESALLGVDIFCLEHYVVAGNKYVGMIDNRSHSFFQRPDFASFVERRAGVVRSAPCAVKDSDSVKYDNGELFDFLYGVVLASLPRDKAESVSLKLLERCEELPKLFSLKIEELTENFEIPTSLAVHLKVIAALISRRTTDKFVSGGRYTEEEMASYFKALYLGRSVETVYACAFDSKERFITCELVTEGTVNTASVLPRKFLELAMKCKSKALVIAHNHPGGVAKPSIDDHSMTNTLSYALANAGVELRSHFIVAGTEFTVIRQGDEREDDN